MRRQMVGEAGCVVLALALLSAATGCSDETHRDATSPSSRAPEPRTIGQSLVQFPDLPDSLPSVAIGARDRPTAPELSDAALAEAVASSGGTVFIGLKPASALRTRETGVVPGISRAMALAARAAITAAGANVSRTYAFSSAVVATVTPERVATLRRLPVVDYVEPIFPGKLMSQSTDWGVAKVRAPAVWAGLYGISTRGEGVNVTILDGGVDEVHRWSGDGPANMFLDCYWVEGAGSSCYGDQTDPDRRGHGVHVAGIIAAIDNSIFYVGVAPNPQRFASIKVCDANGWCDPAYVAAGLDWVLGSGRPRHIVNMSFGWCTNYTLISQMVSSLSSAGVLLVAAAGNYYRDQPLWSACRTGEPNNLGADWPTGTYFPARYSQVVSVSGTLEDDAFAVAPPIPPGGGGESGGGGCGGGDMCGVPNWCFIGSRSGKVEVAAPFWANSLWTNGTYKAACGTSTSAPFVTGVAALVWSGNPGMTSWEVRQRLLSTAVPHAPASRYGAGRVDAVNALYPPPPPPPTLMVSLTGPNPVPSATYCTWIAAAAGGTEPYTYQWAVDGAPAGDGSGLLSITTPSSAFTITVVATDAQGISGGTGWTVGIGGSATCEIQ